jgi:tetratricopeptide (TPR) repeat protein
MEDIETLENRRRIYSPRDKEFFRSHYKGYIALLERLSRVCLTSSLFEEAVKYNIEILDLLDKKQRKEAIKVMNQLARIYLALENYECALFWLKESMKIGLTYIFDSNLEISHTMHLIGQIYITLGNYDLALDYLRESFSTRCLVCAVDDTSNLRLLYDIGVTYETLLDHTTATHYYCDCLSICRSYPCVIFLSVLNHIAHFYEVTGWYQGAIDAIEVMMTCSLSSPFSSDFTPMHLNKRILTLEERIRQLTSLHSLRLFIERKVSHYIQMRSQEHFNPPSFLTSTVFSKKVKLDAANFLLSHLYRVGVFGFLDIVLDERYPFHGPALENGRLKCLLQCIVVKCRKESASRKSSPIGMEMRSSSNTSYRQNLLLLWRKPTCIPLSFQAWERSL